MFADEHVEIATHEDHHGDDDHAESKSGTRHDIHGELHANHQPSWTVARFILAARYYPSVGAIKEA